ncbi:MFS transporter [Solirubrobacter ginsenosidimutans]|uniref:MFS transporter n=1 Tax=Solirubrobacter ginsenosidimutans TaxID=490573 RepID=A0A9X3N1E7_9ACTN|nr:MFS transporter [Solirubrobacter ginsenosidimutans]MDA0166699.1 MFS transporter [Solirubrobacter ginsenosidimutans]
MDRKWLPLVAVAAGVFMLLLDVTIVNVALPDIQIALHASLSDLQWVIDAYALTLAALQLTAGSLADRFGRRLLFAIGIVVFTLGSLLCGLSGNSTFLSLSRAFQGIGGAIMFATGLAIIANAFHGRDRGVAFGVFGAVTGVAVAVGPVIGGALTSGLSWRWIFLVNIPVGVGALYVTLSAVEESRDPNPRPVDYLGLVTFSLGLAALVYGLIRSSEDGWSDTGVWVSLIASVVLLLAFVAAELLQKRPMFDLSLFRKPTFVGGLIAAFAISASLFAAFPYLVLYMQTGLHLSAIEVGVRFLVLSGPIFVTAAIAGRATENVPIRFLIGPGFALVGIALLLMRGLEPGGSWTHFIPGFIVAGVGAGLINVPLASTAVGVVEPARAGMASGINSTLRQVGIATGVAALGTIFSHHVSQARGQNPLVGLVDGLNAILLVGAILALFAAFTSLILIRSKDFVSSSPS